METIDDTMFRLADAVRRRFKTTGQLGLENMIKIIAPPVNQPNLIPGSDNFSGYPGGNWAIFNNFGQSGSWNGIVVMALNLGGLIGYKTTFTPGTYTFSVFAKLDQPDDQSTAVLKFQGDTTDAGLTIKDGLTTEWQRFVYTTTFTTQTTGRFQISPTAFPKGANRLYIAGEKVEQGDTVTPYVTANTTEIDAPIYGK
ncbi:hypothetical protein AB0X64_07265 [Limosilactobacillus vaginalis]|uniref:hypothetical protein n=1 Tax=Limosilactobacillus vaginalis TaxID=1633 RepID=UPI003F202340